MQQFDLSVWLQNKSRKVVTRDGRSVRILDYNLKGDKRICIAADDKTQESITTVDENGHCLIDKTSWHESNFDLFFADDEELYDFESKLFSVISEVWQNYLLGREVDFAETVKEYSGELLDLARNELQITDYLNGYAQGKQDTLKAALESLPKWKKSDRYMECGVDDFFFTLEDDGKMSPYYSTEIEEGQYYLSKQDLLNLPKEE